MKTLWWTWSLALLVIPQSPRSTPPATAPAPSFLVEGDVVPPFIAQGIDGAWKRIEYPRGSTTLLLFFLSSCPTCHKMIPVWSEAYLRRPKTITVVGILLDREPTGFFDTTPVAFPVVRSPGAEFRETFKVHRVPLTLRVAAGGRVEGLGLGALDPIRLGELFRP